MRSKADESDRVRTLTGKEIELDIEADYKVRFYLSTSHATALALHFWCLSRHALDWMAAGSERGHGEGAIGRHEHREHRLISIRSPG